MTGRSTAHPCWRASRADAIEHFWVAYHDYGGRAQGKSPPRRGGFRSAVNDGVVFAMANLNMAADDHQSTGATLLADSGDFLAVPDPRSYAVLPRYPGTARVSTRGCAPATVRSGKAARALGWRRPSPPCGDLGYSAQVALEPEFYLLLAPAGESC